LIDLGGKWQKKRGPQNEGISRQVDENKELVFHSPLSKPSSSTKIRHLLAEIRHIIENKGR
jgi:hypothetical protein